MTKLTVQLVYSHLMSLYGSYQGTTFSRAEQGAEKVRLYWELQKKCPQDPVEGHGFSRAAKAASKVGFSPGDRFRACRG